MGERDFDIIVIGCGCAGSVAAYVAARRGKSVLIVERGEAPGAKNMTGGRIYVHGLRKVFEDYGQGEVLWDKVPLERRITHERLALMDPSRNLSLDFMSDAFSVAGRDSYSVLRGPFDQWMGELCEGVGCDIIAGIAVEELVRDISGTVVGIRAGEDEITAQVVIVAEGVNSLLTERCLGAARPASNEMAVGIKELFEIPSQVIEDRFLLPKKEGAAMLFVGDCTHGNVGGGFLYTNKESISLGLVATIHQLSISGTTICQAMEDFKNHPAVAPVLRDSKMVEHSGHMVSEGGYAMIPKHTYDGCLVAGDAAMLCMNLGYQVRGMDFAVASGRFAAESACEAIDAQDVSERSLSRYGAKLNDSFVIQDLRTFKNWPVTMEGWARMFSEYPSMSADVFEALFMVDGSPQTPLAKRIMPLLKKRGLFSLAKEVRGALKAL